MRLINKSNTHNTTLCRGRDILWLVVHFTAGTSSKAGAASNTAAYFKTTTNAASADFIVDDATSVQYNPDPRNRYCWAVGGTKYPSSKGGTLYGKVTNKNSINVEICSTSADRTTPAANDPRWSFTEAVITQAVELVRYLMKEYGVNADHVIRHYDVTGKWCPGIIGWNKESGSESAWQKFKARLTGPLSTMQATASASPVAQYNTVEKTIWDYLTGKGLNLYAVAGFMGNIYAESSMRANNLQDSAEKRLELSDTEYTENVDSGEYENFATDSAGYGLCQWAYPTRKKALYDLAKASNRSIGDLTLQLDFLWKELREDFSGLLSALSIAASVREASNAVLFQFERPADMSEAVQNKRAGFGQVYYDRYATPYYVRVTVENLNIRQGPGTDTKMVGSIDGGPTIYTIVEVKDSWGRLKSGAGWIYLPCTERAKLTA